MKKRSSATKVLVSTPASQTAFRPFSEHNTPPPTLIVEGSLIIEVTNADPLGNLPNPRPMGTNRQKLVIKPTPYPNGPPVPPNIYIAHVKVVDGSGDPLYMLDNTATQPAEKGTPVEVTATVKKPTTGDTFTCHLTVEADSFAIDIPNGKKTSQKPNDPPLNQRRQRMRFMEDTAGPIDDDFEFTELSINKGSRNLYSQVLKDLPSKGKELRVLLWWEELP